MSEELLRLPHDKRRRRVIGRLYNPKHKRAQKLRMLEDDPHCSYCHSLLTFDNCRLDHWLPALKYPLLARDRSNLVLACGPCDDFKSDKDPTDHFDATAFRASIARGSRSRRLRDVIIQPLES